jgi:CheY-like chemotaxis protein
VSERDTAPLATSVPEGGPQEHSRLWALVARHSLACPTRTHFARAGAFANAECSVHSRQLCRSVTPVAIGTALAAGSRLRQTQEFTKKAVTSRAARRDDVSMASDVTVLVVEDDEALQHRLQQTLRARYTVLTASCWREAHEIRARAAVDVVVADMNLTSGDGTGLGALCAEKGDTPFVLLATPGRLSETSSTEEARPPLLAFPARPVEFRELPGTLDDVIADRRANRDPARFEPIDELTGILAESAAMRGVMQLVDRAAACDTPILLVGESGTGKELLARALHTKSPRAPGPFLAVNCSAIPSRCCAY